MKITFQSGGSKARGTAIEVRFLPRDRREKLQPPISDAEFSGKANAILHLRTENQLLVGLGDRAGLNAQTLRSAAGAAVMFMKKIGRTQLLFNLEDWPEFTGAAVEGAVIADYRFEMFKRTKTAAIASVSIQVLPEDLSAAKRAAAVAQLSAQATNIAREVGNLPGNLLYPEVLASRATKLAKETGLRVQVLDERQLRARKFGGLVAVGGGSSRGPRLIVLEHRGGPKDQPPIALVGKAITFDTGGISIKPAANMEEMVFDKCGGMAVLGAMAGIARLKLKQNVVGVIASAENMPGPDAYRPGDIVTTYDGKHIEIVNTDAEGRMVLADALAYARRDLKAAALIDLATLTGACGVALGEAAAGLWSNDDGLRQQVLDAASKTGERLWPMPLFPEYDDAIKSSVALLKNSGGRLAGASTAAAFLKAFAEETPWAHLDIAYTASADKDRADFARGATGFGVRTLIQLVTDWR